MPNCPPHTYFSVFLDSCIDCPTPNPSGNCHQESNEDMLSCSRSCTAQPTKESTGDGDSTKIVAGIVTGTILVLVFAVILSYRKYRNWKGNRESGSENVENPNDSSELVSIPPRNEATESEEPEIDVATTLVDTVEVLPAVDEHSSNET